MTQRSTAGDESRKVPIWRGEWASFAMMILLLTVARTSLANHYQVPSGSMEPTLMPGDRVAVNMLAYGLRVPFTDIELIDRGEPTGIVELPVGSSGFGRVRSSMTGRCRFSGRTPKSRSISSRLP